MDLGPPVDGLRQQVALAAEAAGDDAAALVERLMPALEAAIRLTLQETLAAAAEEITTDLAPGSVELRVRGRDLEFVVTPPTPEGRPDDHDARGPVTADGDEGATARINLRLPEHLKSRVEAAATRDGVSINAWLVRAASSAVQRNDPERRSAARAARGGQRYTGWAR
jgi:hypothetical protein